MRATEADLKQVLADTLQIDADTIDDDTSVDTVEEWDSLKHLNLVIALEDRFGVTFTEEQVVEILTYPLIRTVLEEQGVELVQGSAER
jgi:acyl carrier protein